MSIAITPEVERIISEVGQAMNSCPMNPTHIIMSKEKAEEIATQCKDMPFF